MHLFINLQDYFDEEQALIEKDLSQSPMCASCSMNNKTLLKMHFNVCKPFSKMTDVSKYDFSHNFVTLGIVNIFISTKSQYCNFCFCVITVWAQ